MITQKQIAECYQPLFDHLSKVYNITALTSEMDEIISVVATVQDSLDELFRATCDVDGCDNNPANGGGCWRETGYWSVCSEHSQTWREGKTQPKMKEEAIEREKTRDEDGILHYSGIEINEKT